MIRHIATVILLALGTAAHGESHAGHDQALAEFWASCARQVPELPAESPYRVRRWGADQSRSLALLALIRDGEKTATFSSPWIYDGDPNQTPVAGGYTLATDFEGQPALVLRTTATRTTPFDQVSSEDSRHEGPAARELEVWRQIHWAYFGRVLEPMGKSPAADMPVTIEHFEVVCADGAASSGDIP